MDANHQDQVSHNLTTTEDVDWVLSKKSKLLIPHHRNRKKRTFRVPFEWLNLIGVLLIPFVVTVLGLYATQQITQQQAKLSNEVSQQQHETDIEIAQDQQRETALQSYFDRMADLLLAGKLRESKAGDEIRNIARSRTLTTLRILDPERKVVLLRFLYEDGLISSKKPVIDMDSADLSRINIYGAKLSGINLSGASLINAILTNSDLSGANLSRAFITNTEMISTILYGANLSHSTCILTNLTQADLVNADINSAILAGDNLTKANLTNADLRDASLGLLKSVDNKKATYTHTNLTNANLTNADLRRVNLEGTIFLGATLNKANLEEDDLTNADLTGAILQYAYLLRAKISDEQRANVSSLKGATMPDGSIHP